MNDKKQQKAAISQEVNRQTGLTPTQERAAMLLAAGWSITAAADKVRVRRQTIYKWQTLTTFQSFFNQCADYSNNLSKEMQGLWRQMLSGKLITLDEQAYRAELKHLGDDVI